MTGFLLCLLCCLTGLLCWGLDRGVVRIEWPPPRVQAPPAPRKAPPNLRVAGRPRAPSSPRETHETPNEGAGNTDGGLLPWNGGDLYMQDHSPRPWQP